MLEITKTELHNIANYVPNCDKNVIIKEKRYWKTTKCVFCKCVKALEYYDFDTPKLKLGNKLVKQTQHFFIFVCACDIAKDKSFNEKPRKNLLKLYAKKRS